MNIPFDDIRMCMQALGQAYAAGYGVSRPKLEAASRVLDWLDALAQPDTLGVHPFVYAEQADLMLDIRRCAEPHLSTWNPDTALAAVRLLAWIGALPEAEPRNAQEVAAEALLHVYDAYIDGDDMTSDWLETVSAY